jgi:alkylhydroperoxidase family enzyme
VLFSNRSVRRKFLLTVTLSIGILCPATAAFSAEDPPLSESARTPASEPRASRIAALDQGEAWKRLPTPLHGSGQHLPIWARTLAATLPHTTAAMLELDYMHRTQSPLPAKLRAQLRWVTAHANHCVYSEAQAEADLRRLGVDAAAIQALAGDFRGLPTKESCALLFARKLTAATNTVTDPEVVGLIKHYGEKQVVALVLLVAYANFQDRLLLALDVSPESEDGLQPLDVQFAGRPTPASRPPLPPSQPDHAIGSTDRHLPPPPPFGDLQKGQEQQRARKARVYLPPENSWQANWGNVCHTYQPELAAAWSACVHAFSMEAEHDPVFEETLFWVVTRSLRCFYCMGHTEMRLAVSGLNDAAISKRAKCLASEDWSAFSPRERCAFAFARKQAENPASITTHDFEELVRHFGRERALDVIWWSCRCHYMTRVADAFGLPLEKDNIFDGFSSNKRISAKK